VSVYPGPSKILSPKAQARSGLRPTSHPAEPAATRTAARRHGLKQSPSASLPAQRLVAASCTLRDTFFGHPVSVCPGPSKILSPKAQVRSGLRPTSHPAEPAATRTAARSHGLKQLPSASLPAQRLVAASCTPRDTFFGHPVSVYPGPSKILSPKAQVRSGLRPTPHPAEPAATRTAARRHGLKQSPSASLPAQRLVAASCTLRDTFFGHPVSVYPGPSKILSPKAQAHVNVHAPSSQAKPTTTKTPTRKRGRKEWASARGVTPLGVGSRESGVESRESRVGRSREPWAVPTISPGVIFPLWSLQLL
jgi:hypothetical protein